MSWFNIYGLIILSAMMIPNVISLVRHRQEFENTLDNKYLELFEQIARYGNFAFMIFNVPYLYVGFWFDNALIVYVAVNAVLLVAYLVGWCIRFKRGGNLASAIVLSVLPSLIFIFSGIMLLSLPLMVCAFCFAVAHIGISVMNAIKA